MTRLFQHSRQLALAAAVALFLPLPSSGQQPTQGQMNPVTAAPSNLRAAKESGQAVRLNWSDNALNASGFRIERSTSDTLNFGQTGTTGHDTTWFIDPSPTRGVLTYYRVRAVGPRELSSYSNIDSIMIPLSIGYADEVIDTLVSSKWEFLSCTDNGRNWQGIAEFRFAGDGHPRLAGTFDYSNAPDCRHRDLVNVRVQDGDGRILFTEHCPSSGQDISDYTLKMNARRDSLLGSLVWQGQTHDFRARREPYVVADCFPGTWELEGKVGQRIYHGLLNLRQDGGKLEGTYLTWEEGLNAVPYHSEGDVVGSVSGAGELSFTRTVTKGGGIGTVQTFSGLVRMNDCFLTITWITHNGQQPPVNLTLSGSRKN